MADCKHCKYAVWDEVGDYPFARFFYVAGCKFDHDEDENCEDFEEYEGDKE